MRGLPATAYDRICGKHVNFYGRREMFFHLVNPVNVIPVSRNFSTGVIRYSGSDERGGAEGSAGAEYMSQGTKSTLYYIAALGVLAFGLSYAAVPLYRIFCQVLLS